MTLKEIAKEAGVSISTVSRVINNKNYHCTVKETEDLIWELVRKTGYIPNETAKSLKQNASRMEEQKKVISCLFARTASNSSDQFFTAIERGVEQETVASGCTLGYSFSAIDLAEEDVAGLYDTSSVDGLVVLGRFSEKLVSFFKNTSKNVVLVGLNVFSAQFDHVYVDGYKAAKKALHYLYALGHRQIAYVGETTNEVRYNAFLDFMRENHLPVELWQCAECHLSLKGGQDAAEALLRGEALPTAVFCANDITAIGVMKAIRQAHLSVPDDISVISIDDIEMSQFVTPALTTIHIPKKELGRMAVKLLTDRMNKGHSLKLRLELPCDLIIRGSCDRPCR